MAVIETDLRWYFSEVVSDTPDNGGVMSDNEIPSGVSHALWPIALSDELLIGSVLYRKIFLKNTNVLGDTLNLAHVWTDIVTVADDYIVMFPGTQTDTEADFQNYVGDIFACANIAADVTAGASTFDVIIDDPELEPAFIDGAFIRLTNKLNPVATAGTVDLVNILGAPTVVGNLMTITVDTPIANTYLVSETSRVSVLSPVGNIVATIDPLVVNSVGGTYNEGAFPPIHDNIAGVEEIFTLDFTDPTNFTCTGSRVGVVGSGNTGADFAPINTVHSRAYFTLEAGGFGGSFLAGDSIILPSHPAAVPIILKRTIPTGTSNLSGNNNRTGWSGEVA